jgi:hypothetical protein
MNRDDCGLAIADWRLADCRLVIADLAIADLAIVDCRLHSRFGNPQSVIRRSPIYNRQSAAT